jgi:hypothetical protein
VQDERHEQTAREVPLLADDPRATFEDDTLGRWAFADRVAALLNRVGPRGAVNSIAGTEPSDFGVAAALARPARGGVGRGANDAAPTSGSTPSRVAQIGRDELSRSASIGRQSMPRLGTVSGRVRLLLNRDLRPLAGPPARLGR